MVHLQKYIIEVTFACFILKACENHEIETSLLYFVHVLCISCMDGAKEGLRWLPSFLYPLINAIRCSLNEDLIFMGPILRLIMSIIYRREGKLFLSQADSCSFKITVSDILAFVENVFYVVLPDLLWSKALSQLGIQTEKIT